MSLKSENTRIYLAGPLTGLPINESYTLFSTRQKELEEVGFEVLNPFSAKAHLLTEEEGEVLEATGYNDPISNDRAVLHRDFWMVSRADIFLADFSRAVDRVSIGTVAEIAWAYKNQNPSTMIILTGMDAENHVMRHCFITEMATHIFPNYSDAVHYLKQLAGA